MTLIPAVDLASSPPAVADLLTALPDLHVFRTLGHASTLFKPWLDQGGAILSTLALDPVLRELIVLQAAAAAGCDYELAQHMSIAAGVGARAEQVELAITPAAKRLPHAEAEWLTPVQRLGLRIAEAVVRDGRATAADVASIRALVSDRVVVEFLMVIGYYIATAIVLKSLDVDVDIAAEMTVVDLAQRHNPDVS